jgi:tetratricopeptide (TPR) repeat protein
VARHLVAAGALIDDDPDQALAHARAARDRASRIAPVREAVGVAAYYAGDYAEAARELRAYRRMTGGQGYRAVLADCERALGRPEVALRMVTDALADRPDAAERVELHLVEAGARRDLGEGAAARLVLEDALGGRPVPASLGSDAGLGTLRLASAYADLLRDEGEDELADQWLAAIAAADPENEVGALERLGVAFEDPDDDLAQPDTEPEVESLATRIRPDIEADAEAEVAELLGETPSDPAPGDAGPGGH